MEMLFSIKNCLIKSFRAILFFLIPSWLFPEKINERIKLYTLCTPTHQILKNKYFLPSIKDDFEVIVKNFDQNCKTGKYMCFGWNNTMLHKVDLILSAIKENWGKIFIYSDVDIQFFKEFKYRISDLINNKDIVIQKTDRNGNLCAGFFISRGNQATYKLWNEIKQRMIKNSKLDDQIPLNHLLLRNNIFNVNWDFLPDEFYNPGLSAVKIWNPNDNLEIPKNIILHHACFTIGVANKIKQLEYVKNKLKDQNSKMIFHEYFLDLFMNDQVKTELTAYQLLKSNPIDKNINYLAIPWAVLINQKKLKLVPNIKIKGPSFTICQHVDYEKIIPILKRIGINVLFTPHVKKRYSDIKVLPIAHLANNMKLNIENKDIYYSFIGLDTHNSRTKLFKMKHDKNSVMIKRNQWHFDQKDVSKQIKEKIEYENVLSRSRFSLCPRGYGASTLRFWESLKVGAIPILISDDMQLPAGFDWAKSIIRIKEKDISNFNNVLSKISPKKEEQMRKNCLKAYCMFCEDNFVKVVRDYYKSN